MILYTHNALFLGIGKEELLLLGYEDMEEFSQFCHDIADLFEEKKGFVAKSKTFSWINYVLHSGDELKHALLKTKYGKSIEVAITIEEIFLLSEENACYYSVKLTPLKQKEGILYQKQYAYAKEVCSSIKTIADDVIHQREQKALEIIETLEAKAKEYEMPSIQASLAELRAHIINPTDEETLLHVLLSTEDAFLHCKDTLET